MEHQSADNIIYICVGLTYIYANKICFKLFITIYHNYIPAHYDVCVLTWKIDSVNCARQ